MPTKAITDESNKGVEKLLAVLNKVSARALSAYRRDKEKEERGERPECALEEYGETN